LGAMVFVRTKAVVAYRHHAGVVVVYLAAVSLPHSGGMRTSHRHASGDSASVDKRMGACDPFLMYCRAVSLAFMHDRSVPSHCSVEQHPLITVIPSPSQQEGQQPAAPYPPNGCLMPQGSVLLAAPLCFMFDSPHAVYRLHRAMYCRCVNLSDCFSGWPI
jgi:hypothetical protein